MRTDRSYRKALPFDLAATEMESVSGTQLDPRIVAVLLETVQGEQEHAQSKRTLSSAVADDQREMASAAALMP
jgi:HD-GYP domain-containing protein (c-di-GMP phosphodiesterase class II)